MGLVVAYGILNVCFGAVNAARCDHCTFLTCVSMQVSQLNFRVVLEDQLLLHMLGTVRGDEPMTGDSLARVLQCFGPCMQVNVGSKAVQQQVRTTDEGSVAGKRTNMVAGMVVSTGEVCNAAVTASHVAFSSVVRSPLVLSTCHCAAESAYGTSTIQSIFLRHLLESRNL